MLLGDAGANALPRRGELALIVVVEMRQEPLVNAREVGRARLGELPAAVGGDLGEQSTSVAGARLARDEPVALHAVDETRDPALAEEHGRGELAHSQLTSGRPVEADQHLVLRQRKPVLGFELTVELPHERGVEAEKAPPRCELRNRQLVTGRDGTSSVLFDLASKWNPSGGHGHDNIGSDPADGLSRRDSDMKLEGIHHVTAITGDAPGNVDFYARVLGLRLVKKTVNQDDPTVYHLFYADENRMFATTPRVNPMISHFFTFTASS